MSDWGWADTIAVDDRLCLALYRASRAVTAAYRPVLAPLGLTYTQYAVLSVLWEDGPASVGEIGNRLGLDSNTLSPLLKRLEADGLVLRRRDRRDERAVLVSLTPVGQRLRQQAQDIPARVCEAAGLDARDQAELVNTLQALTARLDP